MSVDNRGTTDVPRWYYSFMIRGVRYFGSIPEARTKAEASKVEAMKRLEVYEGRYCKETRGKGFLRVWRSGLHGIRQEQQGNVET